MIDPSLKNRESQVDENEPTPQADDNEPDVRVVREDGQEPRIEGTGKTRAEMRREEWNKRVSGVVSESNKPLLDQITQLERTIQGLGAMVTNGAQARQAPQQQAKQENGGVDPDFLSTRRRQSEIMTLLGSAKTQADVDRLESEYYRLDQEALDKRAEKLASARLDRFEREHPAQEPAEFRQLRQEFPDVVQRPDVLQYAGDLFKVNLREAQMSGKQFNEIDIHRKSMQTAAERANIRRPPAPAPRAHEQARFGGAPPAAGRGGASFSYKLSKQQSEIAQSLAPPGTPVADAEAKWAREMLKRDPNFFA